MFRGSVGHRTWPLMPVLRRVAPMLPLVAVLGLVASLLEGAGIGLFIPLLSLLLSDPSSDALPQSIRSLAALFDDYHLETRVAMLAAGILALILLKGLVQGANEYLTTTIQARAGKEIRQRLAANLLTLDYRFFLEHHPARLTRIVSTDSWFVLEAVQSALKLIPAATGLLVFAFLLAWLNLFLFAIVLVGGGLVQATLYLFERRQERLSLAVTASNQRLWARLVTLVQAPRVIRLFGQEEREKEQTAAAIEQLRGTAAASHRLSAFVHPVLDAMIALLFLVVLLAAYWKGIPLPAVTVFMLLLTRAQPHAKAISGARIGIASFRGSLQEVEWLLSQRPAETARTGARVEVKLDRPISFEKVSYTYPNGHRGLSNVSVTIPPGAATALIGESGSGKTTLVNLLCRLVHPEAGEIRLGDQPIGQIEPLDWRTRIAVAGQDSELVTGTVAENIAYGRPDAASEEIEEAARAAGAEDFIVGFPQGYETLLGPNGLSLSGGQRQRIGLARALLTNPDLLILDEATNAVDALAEAEIMKLIAEHRYFQTMLVISHRKTTVSACQHGIVLDNGRVRESGPLSDLAYYQAMAGQDFENSSRAHG